MKLGIWTIGTRRDLKNIHRRAVKEKIPRKKLHQIDKQKSLVYKTWVRPLSI